MGEYYFIVKIGAILIILITLVALIALFGWMKSCEQLRLERSRGEALKKEKAIACSKYSTLKNREMFLLNRITELSEERKEAVLRADRLSFENISLSDRLKKSLAAVRENVDTDDTDDDADHGELLRGGEDGCLLQV